MARQGRARSADGAGAAPAGEQARAARGALRAALARGLWARVALSRAARAAPRQRPGPCVKLEAGTNVERCASCAPSSVPRQRPGPRCRHALGTLSVTPPSMRVCAAVRGRVRNLQRSAFGMNLKLEDTLLWTTARSLKNDMSRRVRTRVIMEPTNDAQLDSPLQSAPWQEGQLDSPLQSARSQEGMWCCRTPAMDHVSFWMAVESWFQGSLT